MSPSATPATQNDGECHQVPRLPRKVARPSATSATPATPNAGRCLQGPRLPRKTKVNVTKCHACHAKWCGAPGDQRRPTATNGDQVHHQVQQVPHLPLQTQVDVSKCHACHVIATSATPATPNAGRCLQVPRLLRKVARRPANGDQARHQLQLVPRLPRKTKVLKL